MKKIILSTTLLGLNVLSAQFKIDIKALDSFANKRIIIYKQSGSKEFILSQTDKKKGKWLLNIPNYYKGMLRAYFPENGQSVSFISENKDIEIKLETENDKVKKVDFIDEANKKWDEVTTLQQKKESILPVLLQIKTFYNNENDFAKALADEILKLEKTQYSIDNESFLEFYLDKLKYASRESRKITLDEYQNILLNSNEMLETSLLVKPILINILKNIPRENIVKEVDSLLEKLNLDTNRGQIVLSELLSIFETYGLEEEKNYYYQKASALTCSINNNLEISITSIKNTLIGAIFEDYIFTSMVKSTKAKKLSEIKANKKIVLFWSSTCPHCLSELPIILENYKTLKEKNIEVIAISLDSDRRSYENQVGILPWINDTELRGWKSSFVEKYNINATPTYYILDSNDKIIDKPANFSVFLNTIN